MRTDDKTAKISYSGVQAVCRFIMLGLFFLICFCIGTVIGSTMALITDAIDGETVVPAEFILHSIPFYIMTALVTVLIVIFLRGLKRIPKEDAVRMGGKLRTVPAENFRYTPAEEKQLIKEGRLLKKTKLGWFYNPDRINAYIQQMAREGWLLYRLDDMGTAFFFEKGEPANIEFVTDLQSNCSEEYFSSCAEDGWKLEFASFARVWSYACWSRRYESERPDFYSDSETKYEHAKKFFISTGLPVLFFGAATIAAMIFFIAKLSGGEMFEEEGMEVLVLSFLPYPLVSAELMIFGISNLKYYLDARRDRKNNE